MIAQELKPYAEARQVSLTWLQSLPVGWDLVRAKNIFRPVNVRSETGTEELLTVSSNHGVVRRSQANVTMFKAESYIGHKLCRPDDLVVNSLWAWMQGLGFSRYDGLVSSAYSVYRPHTRFVGYVPYFNDLLRSAAYKWELMTRSKGVWISRLQLSDQSFLDMPIIVPPPTDAEAIIRFVGHVDGLIRRQISAKRKLLKLLEEQKQAIIHRSITQGLAANPGTRQTGNRWFPEIPTHWALLPMRRVIYRAVDGPHHSPEYQDDGVPFLSARNVKSDRWSLDDIKFISKTDYDEFSKRVTPERGDVLYTKGGTTGVARVVDLECPFQVWVHIAVLKIRQDKIIPDFLAAALNSPRCYEQSQLFTRGATNQDLGLSRMKDIVLPVPPISEQRDILTMMRTELTPYVAAADDVREQVSVIQEYRSRLVADVVTGKLDVRAAAAKLPEPSTELEEAAGMGLAEAETKETDEFESEEVA